ncbi:MAG TPA: endonuclease VII domain-containing protein [Candidatus Angelobacter sp.]|jgi:hypothetical protein|nr:endonuclease VII domain-containing protein [Candidatus Angelobacter sp.]
MDKRCPGCATEKSVAEFQKNRRAKDGLQYHCKACRKAIDARAPRSEYLKARYHADKERVYLDPYYRRAYGISIDEYKAMYGRQGGVCAICQQPCKSGRRLAVDHSHESGAVRGLLCSRCNSGLADFQDNPALLAAAIEYLKS